MRHRDIAHTAGLPNVCALAESPSMEPQALVSGSSHAGGGGGAWEAGGGTSRASRHACPPVRGWGRGGSLPSGSDQRGRLPSCLEVARLRPTAPGAWRVQRRDGSADRNCTAARRSCSPGTERVRTPDLSHRRLSVASPPAGPETGYGRATLPQTPHNDRVWFAPCLPG